MVVERWDTYEVVLETGRRYQNPFSDVEVTAEFTHTDTGTTVTVNGFYDGEQTWRLRFMPTLVGAWGYRTISTDPVLDGKIGTIDCVEPTASFLHGPLHCRGHHFIHADGTPRFVISTRLSCQFADPTLWPPVVAFLKEHHINRVFFMLGGVSTVHTGGDTSGTFASLYGPGEGGGPDFGQYNVAAFQAIDLFVDTLRHADIIAAPYLYYFNDGTQRKMSLDQDRAYIRYTMARLAPYANVMPVLANEVEQKYTVRLGGRRTPYDLRSHDWANDMGQLLKDLSVFGTPVTVHNPMENTAHANPGFYTLLADWPFKWADYMLRQAQVGALGAVEQMGDDVPESAVAHHNPRGAARHNQLLIDLRSHGIPVINEEPGYEMGGAQINQPISARSWASQTAWRFLDTLWTATTAGTYTMWGSPATYELGDPMWGLLDSVVPGRLKILHDVMTRLPYQQMEPFNEAVSPGDVEIGGARYRSNFCLAQPGHHYVVYSIRCGDVKLTLPERRRYRLTNLDPRTGHENDLGTVGGTVTVHLPGRQQVLLASSAK